jgi:homoserine kinase
MTDQEMQNEALAESPAQQELTFRVPAAAAGLGPGAETIALALQLYLKVTVRVHAPRKGEGPEIIANGAIAKQIPVDRTNLIAKAIEHAWAKDPRLLSCLTITFESDIPVAAGLGGSAAATAAGVSAAMALNGVQLEKGAIFAETAKIEGQADSACASIFGGFTICAPNIIPGDFLPRRLSWPDKWCTIMLVPPYTIPAKKSRGALPASISRKDAIMNVQRTALLVEGVAAADEEAMRAALRDKLHEPYRAKFVPELAEVRKLLQEFDVLGSVMCGNGPSILTIAEVDRKQAILERLDSWAKKQTEPCRVMPVEVDTQGLVLI